jgi:dipeptidyl aminopeptidase/acylaminoacyl peptidase
VLLFGSEAGPLRKVKVVNGAADGVCAVVTKPEPGVSEWLPEFLPDGNHFFYLTGPASQRHVYLAALNDPKPRMILADNSGVVYAPPAKGATLGHLLFLRDTTLMAQPFDEATLAAVGDPFAVISPVAVSLTLQQVAASVTADGMLLYQAAPSQDSQLTWLDRNGKPAGKAGQLADQQGVSLSPDETKAATLLNNNQGTRLFDLRRGAESRYNARGLAPMVWAPDGGRVAYFVSGKIYRANSAGGNEEELLASPNPITPSQWTKDGRFLLYTESHPKTRGDIWYLPDPAGKPGQPVKFLVTDSVESQAQLSPDGRWVAYASEETGRSEVWLRSFPDGGNKTPVSLIGGREPRWRADGKELFFVSAVGADLRAMMAVPVQTGAKLTLGTPEQLFTYRSRIIVIQRNQYHFAPSADGQKFLITLQADQTEPTLNLVTDWHRLIQSPASELR